MQSIEFKRNGKNIYNTTAPIRTASGRPLVRYFKGVGQLHKNTILLQKNYCSEVIPFLEFKSALENLQKNYPLFQYECVSYNPRTQEIQFYSCPEFDSADTPMLKQSFIHSPKRKKLKYGECLRPIYHKWMLVKDDYLGFNVQEAYELSRKGECC